MKQFIKFAISVQVLTFVVGLCLISTIAAPFAAFAFVWWMK